MPMDATTKMVAAVVRPVTPPVRAWIIEPAPMKPMPGMICEAMRVPSPLPSLPASCMERMVNSAAPKEINILVRSPAGRRLSSRSRPMNPPSTAASNRRRMLCPSGPSQAICGKKIRVLFMCNQRRVCPPTLSAHYTIDDSPCLPGSVDCSNGLESLRVVMHCAGYRVAHKSNNVVGGLGRPRERVLPGGMVVLTQPVLQRESHHLERCRMRAAIHQHCGPLRQRL